VAFAFSACTAKPADTEVAKAPEATAPTEASAPAPAPAPIPAPTPAPAKPAARKPAAPKPDVAAAPSTPAPAPAAAPQPEQTAALRNEPAVPVPPPAPKKPEPVIVPVGTELNVILSDPLNSGKNKAGDVFVASLAAPVYANGATLLERGAKVNGTVVAAEGSGRVSGKANMKLALTGVTHNGKMVTITTNDLAAEAESTTGRDAKVVGGGAGIGAIIGAIAGGKKGAAVGAAVGGGAGTGTVLATKGKEVDFPAESKLTFTLGKELSVIP
jgi:hypothetical protein